jgi:hypothetical protein
MSYDASFKDVQAWACPKIELSGDIRHEISWSVVDENKTLCNFLVTYSRVTERPHSFCTLVDCELREVDTPFRGIEQKVVDMPVSRSRRTKT